MKAREAIAALQRAEARDLNGASPAGAPLSRCCFRTRPGLQL